MILYDKTGERYPTSKAKQPRFSGLRQNWDYQEKTVDGSKVQFHYDSYLGYYFYFRFNGQWYRLRYNNVITAKRHWDAWDVTSFFTQQPVSAA